MKTITILSDQEFDNLPTDVTRGSDISHSLGFADPKSGRAFVRYTAHHDLNKYLVTHELEELLADKSLHEDENGIRHKGFLGFGGGEDKAKKAQEEKQRQYENQIRQQQEAQQAEINRINAGYYQGGKSAGAPQGKGNQGNQGSISGMSGTLNPLEMFGKFRTLLEAEKPGFQIPNPTIQGWYPNSYKF